MHGVGNREAPARWPGEIPKTFAAAASESFRLSNVSVSLASPNHTSGELLRIRRLLGEDVPGTREAIKAPTGRSSSAPIIQTFGCSNTRLTNAFLSIALRELRGG